MALIRKIRRELSVRRALGATRARLVRQFVIEGLVIVVAGSLVALASSHWAMRILLGLIPKDMMAGMPYLNELGWNSTVLTSESIKEIVGVVDDIREGPLDAEILILKEASVLALAGIVIGAGCAMIAATLMRKLLFGTPPWDLDAD